MAGNSKGWRPFPGDSRTWPGCAGLSRRGKLVKALKEEGWPAHSLSHARYQRDSPRLASLQAGEGRCPAVVDLAFASMSGSTSQPKPQLDPSPPLQHYPAGTTRLEPPRPERILGLLGKGAGSIRAVWTSRRRPAAPRSISHEMPGGPIIPTWRSRRPAWAWRARWPEIGPLLRRGQLALSATSSRSPPPRRWWAIWPCSSSAAASGRRTWRTFDPGVHAFPRERHKDMLGGGLGWPLGAGPNRFWESLCSGRKGFLKARKRLPGRRGPGDAAEGAGQSGADLEKLRASFPPKLQTPGERRRPLFPSDVSPGLRRLCKHRQTYRDVKRACPPLPSSTACVSARKSAWISSPERTLIIRVDHVSESDKDGAPDG